MLVDTHCHLNFDSFADDLEIVIQRASEADVQRIIIPAVDLQNCQSILDIADRYNGVFAAVGIHPNSSVNFDGQMITEIQTFARHPKVVAIGEIGLDYYWRESPKETQRRALEAQLELAKLLQLPVIIHNRDASEDVIAILETWASDLPSALKNRPGVMHSFSAPQEIAERALAAGFYLGFTGPITYKNADQVRRIAASVPLERLLVETDGPFLTPVPYRGKRNEPAYIPLIVERLASLRQLSPAEVGAATTENAKRLFRLPS
ncbi:MAG: TatD family hydrolase [Anaerolineae bacterium]